MILFILFNIPIFTILVKINTILITIIQYGIENLFAPKSIKPFIIN